MACNSCRKTFDVVGVDPKNGPLNRCQNCGEYWVLTSNRILPEGLLQDHESPHAESMIHRGSKELGLANSILLGCTINHKILAVANNRDEALLEAIDGNV